MSILIAKTVIELPSVVWDMIEILQEAQFLHEGFELSRYVPRAGSGAKKVGFEANKQLQYIVFGSSKIVEATTTSNIKF